MKRHWTEWPDSLYEKFMKYPEWVRIAIAIVSVLAILILFSIPGSTIVTAAIAFGATFSGIFVSFWVERRRKEAEGRNQFARMVQGMLIESVSNEGLLRLIINAAKPGSAVAVELRTETLQTALSNPLFFKLADHGLVIAAGTVRTQLATLNNFLIVHRQAVSGGRGMTNLAVKQLRIQAAIRDQMVQVLQDALEGAAARFDATVLVDRRSKKIGDQLVSIVNKEAVLLEEIEQTNEGTA